MWIVAGLGNPGERYLKTRHNVGFMVVDALNERVGAKFRHAANYEAALGTLGGERLLLMKPLTFMNLSGDAVQSALSYYKIAPSSLIVVHDDLDLDTGRLKIRLGGGSGGHKGIASIIEAIGSEFLRVKIGIGRPAAGSAEGYVLGRFTPDEESIIGEKVARGADAVEAIVTLGHVRAMTLFNS